MDNLNQKINLIYSIVTEGQRRYTYLLLAVAASAIALSLKNTENETLDWYLFPVGIAVLFWAISFFLGVICLRKTRGFHNLNLEYLQMHTKDGEREEAEKYSKGIEANLDKENKISTCFSNWQLCFLGLGALSYIVWHVLRLYINTYCSS